MPPRRPLPSLSSSAASVSLRRIPRHTRLHVCPPGMLLSTSAPLANIRPARQTLSVIDGGEFDNAEGPKQTCHMMPCNMQGTVTPAAACRAMLRISDTARPRSSIRAPGAEPKANLPPSSTAFCCRHPFLTTYMFPESCRRVLVVAALAVVYQLLLSYARIRLPYWECSCTGAAPLGLSIATCYRHRVVASGDFNDARQRSMRNRHGGLRISSGNGHKECLRGGLSRYR